MKQKSVEWKHWVNNGVEDFWSLDVLPEAALVLYVTHRLAPKESKGKKVYPYVATYSLCSRAGLRANGQIWTVSRKTLAVAQHVAIKEAREVLWSGMHVVDFAKVGE